MIKFVFEDDASLASTDARSDTAIVGGSRCFATRNPRADCFDLCPLLYASSEYDLPSLLRSTFALAAEEGRRDMGFWF